jgi:hypothetical protein
VLAPDVWGLDIGGVTYNVTVNNPDGSVFHRMGLISNTTNQISYDPQSNDINNGKLPTMDGVYHVTVIFTEIRDYVKLQDFLPIWGITVTAMDVGPIVDNAGPAVQLDSHSKTGILLLSSMASCISHLHSIQSITPYLKSNNNEKDNLYSHFDGGAGNGH